MKPDFFLAFDPGRTTGVAYWHPGSNDYDAWQTKDPYEALRWARRKMLNRGINDFGLSVEKYAGSGYKTADGIYTSELVGFYHHWFEFYFKNQMVSRLPLSQQRLSGLEIAKTWADVANIEGPHSWDALAHTIVHAREYE